MNRLTVLIPVLIAGALIALVFVLVPMWHENTVPPTTMEGAADLPAPPEVNIKGTLTHDFGLIRIAVPRELVHTFSIRNAEDHAIEVFVEGTSCNCLAGELSKSTLEPGEAAEIHVTLQVSKAGPTVQKVYVNADGALVTLHMTADVVLTSSNVTTLETSRN